MNELKVGLRFYSRHFEGAIEIVDISESENTLHVEITSNFGVWREFWNLQHTKTGFDRLDYWTS